MYPGVNESVAAYGLTISNDPSFRNFSDASRLTVGANKCWSKSSEHL